MILVVTVTGKGPIPKLYPIRPTLASPISGMVANPSLMREMTRNADRALGQLDAMPGGHNALVPWLLGDEISIVEGVSGEP